MHRVIAVTSEGQLLDLLVARLQFERTGVHLYDCLLVKLDTGGAWAQGPGSLASLRPVAREPWSNPSTNPPNAKGPGRADLVELRNDELLHVQLLERVIDDLGGEPAAITPAASREVIAMRGIGEVISDPRSSLLDGVEAMVIAELADHEQWMGLLELAREMEREDLARSFLTAQSTEHRHLSQMRVWISALRTATRVEVR